MLFLSYLPRCAERPILKPVLADFYKSSEVLNCTPLLPSFFEDVQIHPLSHRGGKYNVETTDLQIISYEFEYRGSKAAFGPGLPPFWLRHEQAFEGACQIFEKLFNHEADLFAWFYDENKTWNAFLVTSQRFVQPEPLQLDRREDFPERAAFNRHFDSFPVIGSFNSYDINANPGFYYLIATPFSTGKGSFLTLSNFRFQRYEDKARFVESYPKVNPLTKTVEIVCKEFSRSEQEFNELLDNMAGGYIDQQAFMPVVLDLYNINRNTESVANDSLLQLRIRRTVQAVYDFLPPKQRAIPWTDFIQFIIRNNEVDLNSGLRQDEVEELFSRKRAYTKFEELFRKFLKNPLLYDPYVEGQQTAWSAVERLL